VPTSTYSSSLAGRVWSFIGGLLLTAIASIAIPRIVLSSMIGIHTTSVLLVAFVVIVIAGIAIAGVFAFWLGPITIRTTPTHVELLRGSRVRETWARADTHFASFIIRQSTNGIPSGVTRKLLVTGAGQRVELVCRWFSKKTFNALIADVAPQVPEAHAPVAAPAPITVSTGTFTLDHSPVRRSRTVATVILVVGLLSAAAVVAIGVGQEYFDVLIVTAGFALIMVVAIAALFILRGMRLPRQLTVSPSMLTVDDRSFAIGQLTGISATPALYENAGGRAVTLVDTTGRRTVIRLGNFGNRTFPDYDRFLEALRGATAHRPGLFTLDVG